MELELYVHFPFCRQKCLYCDFCSATGTEEEIKSYCKALINEIEFEAPHFMNDIVRSIFIGGGTPSVISAESFKQVMEAIYSNFRIQKYAEITSEANPGTITAQWLETSLNAGVNRFSLGLQAAQDRILKAIGRIHTVSDVQDTVKLLRSYQINNLNLDVMYGLPYQGTEDYLDTIETVCDLKPEHVSAYSLILEPETPLEKMVSKGDIILPSDDETADMADEGNAVLTANGYVQYEISNYAKPGYECLHNLGYWQCVPYLGLGCAAHSMLLPAHAEYPQEIFRIRRSNAADTGCYIRTFNCNEPEMIRKLRTENMIDREEAMFETIMLGTRLTEGVSEQYFCHEFGRGIKEYFPEAVDSLIKDGLAVWYDEDDGASYFRLTKKGLQIQNEVLLRFMK